MSLITILKNLYWRFLKTPEQYARHIGVTIGKGCYISSRGFSGEPYLIEIGDYVRIANNVHFYTHGGIWALRKAYNNPKLDYFGKIKVGDYTHIGDNCMIMPGVTIGSRCVIGGGTVLTKSVPDGCMVAGNPAKFIGYTNDFYNRMTQISTETGGMSREEKEKTLKNLPDSAFTIKKAIRLPEAK